jgi:hypothetical protein
VKIICFGVYFGSKEGEERDFYRGEVKNLIIYVFGLKRGRVIDMFGSQGEGKYFKINLPCRPFKHQRIS